MTSLHPHPGVSPEALPPSGVTVYVTSSSGSDSAGFTCTREAHLCHRSPNVVLVCQRTRTFRGVFGLHGVAGYEEELGEVHPRPLSFPSSFHLHALFSATFITKNKAKDQTGFLWIWSGINVLLFFFFFRMCLCQNKYTDADNFLITVGCFLSAY